MISTILLTLTAIALIIFIIYMTKNDTQEKFISEPYIQDPIYGQYFNPYFIKPSTCMETLFGTIECYDLPKHIWTNDWWFNR